MALRQPTGSCYEHATHWMFDFGDPFDMTFPDGAVIVHGYPTLTVQPFDKYGHAWVELGDLVFDCSQDPVAVFDRHFYYGVGKINPDEVVRYTRDEAMECLVEDYACYGPWDEPPTGVTFTKGEE